MKRSPIKRKTPLKRGTSKLKRTPLKRVSKKRRKELKEYSSLRKDYLSEHPFCECNCGRKATDIHHKNKRHKEKLNDTEYFMAVCRKCHQEEIHGNPKKAREKQWLI